jgi:hypothetical protein
VVCTPKPPILRLLVSRIVTLFDIPRAIYSIKRLGAAIVEADLNRVAKESLRHIPEDRLKPLYLLCKTIAEVVRGLK